MGEMAYVGPPSRGSSSFPYGRSALMEEALASNAHFSNLRGGGIEDDLALIRQGERAQQQQLSDEGMLHNIQLLL